MKGVGIVFSRYLHIPDWQESSLEWSLGDVRGPRRHERNHLDSIVQYGILILAYVVPAIFIANIITGNPNSSNRVDKLRDAVGRLDAIHKDLGLRLIRNPLVTRTILLRLHHCPGTTCSTCRDYVCVDGWHRRLAACYCSLLYNTERSRCFVIQRFGDPVYCIAYTTVQLSRFLLGSI